MNATLTFTKCIQDVQDVGTEDAKNDRMVSRLFFTLRVGDKTYEDMQVEIRQSHGFQYADTTLFPIEVSLPTGSFKGPWHHESLSRAAENYYRGIFGARGNAVNFPAGAHLRMRDNLVIQVETYVVEIPDRGGTW